VAELQLLLERAEKTIERQGLRIKVLEKMLKEKGFALPKDEEISVSEFDPNEDETTTTSSATTKEGGRRRILEESDIDEEEMERIQREKEEMLLEKKMWEMNRNDDETRIRLLEEELMSEQNNVQTQTEKLNILKEEFELANAKVMTSEKENEALILKLATLTLRMQELEENYIDQETQLEVVTSLKEALIAENEELRTNNQYLMQTLEKAGGGQLSEKDVAEAIGQTPKKDWSKISPPTAKSDKKGKETEENPEQERMKMEIIGNEVAKKLAHQFNVENEEVFRTLILQCFEQVKVGEKEISQEEKRRLIEKRDNEEKIKRLQEELMVEKDSKKRMDKEYERLVQDYDKIAKGRVTDFEQIKQKILNEAAVKERAKYERERNLIIKDLQNRVDKVVELEILLDGEKERANSLEGSMTEGEKSLRKKVISLESNLEQITTLYHQVCSQKANLNLDNQVISYWWKSS